MSTDQQPTLEQLLSILVHNASDEDPLTYFSEMYKTINPSAIRASVNEAKKIVHKENRKNGDQVNVYLTLGGDEMDRHMYTGFIGGMLWIQNYLDVVAEHFGIEQADLDVTRKVLRTIGLPKAIDAKYDNVNNVTEESSSCKHYAKFLASFITWLTSGVSSFRVKGEMRTNLELCRYLTGMALDSFPSIPFSAYYIGTIKSTNKGKLAEKLSRSVDVRKYMTDESITLNQPKFVVQTPNAPIVGTAQHPLGEIIYGQEMNGKVEWLGLFQESEEFEKICLKAGLTANSVREYIFSTTPEAHQIKLAHKDKIAMFIEAQHLTKDMFALRHNLANAADKISGANEDGCARDDNGDVVM